MERSIRVELYWLYSFVIYIKSYLQSGSSFRDRRYEYKGLNKVWKGKLSEAKASGNSIKIQEAQVWMLLTLLSIF